MKNSVKASISIKSNGRVNLFLMLEKICLKFEFGRTSRSSFDYIPSLKESRQKPQNRVEKLKKDGKQFFKKVWKPWILVIFTDRRFQD